MCVCVLMCCLNLLLFGNCMCCLVLCLCCLLCLIWCWVWIFLGVICNVV